jgi:hypothetical protein
MDNAASVHDRIRRLETQQRWTRGWCVLSTVSLGVVVLGSMQTTPSKELVVDRVVAQRYELVDEAGAQRGFLGFDVRRGVEEKSVALALYGPPAASSSRIYVRAGLSGSEIHLSDSWKSVAAWIQADEDGAKFTAGSAPKGANGVTLMNASLKCVEGEGRVELKQDVLDAELSKDGKTGLDQRGRLVITPVGGVMKN